MKGRTLAPTTVCPAGPDGPEAADPGSGEGAGTAGGGAGTAGRAGLPDTAAVGAVQLPAPGGLQEEEGGLVQLRVAPECLLGSLE